MGIVTVLYLLFWTLLLHRFQDSLQGVTDSIASALLTQMGLQFSSMLITLLTIMLGAGSISTELENGLVHAILSRPLRRSEYVLGKFFGLAIVACAYATALYAFLLGISAGYGLSTVTALSFGQLLGGWILYLLVPLGILCLTLFGSASMRTVPNGLLMIFIYILGNVGGMVEMVGNLLQKQSVISIGVFISLVSPFHTLYVAAERVLMPSTGTVQDMIRSGSGLTGGGAPISAWMYAYITAYMLGFLGLTLRKFGKRDIV